MNRSSAQSKNINHFPLRKTVPKLPLEVVPYFRESNEQLQNADWNAGGFVSTVLLQGPGLASI